MKIDEMLQAVKDYWLSKRYKLTEFTITDGDKKPFALILPGGGYKMVCSFVEGLPFAKELNKRGYAAFVLRYQTDKNAEYPAPIEDVAKALRYISVNADRLNVDINNYSIWGSSAGGHLAGCFSSSEIGWKKYDLPKPTATILTYPVVTMGKFTHQGSKNLFLGENPSEELIQNTSVENLVDESFPPTFVWCSATDKEVNPVNSEMLVKALEKNGIRHKFVKFESGSHGIGLGIGTECEKWFDKAIKFWNESDEMIENV